MSARFDQCLSGAHGTTITVECFLKIFSAREHWTRLLVTRQESSFTRALSTPVVRILPGLSILQNMSAQFTFLLRTDGAAVTRDEDGVGAALSSVTPGGVAGHHSIMTLGHTAGFILTDQAGA